MSAKDIFQAAFRAQKEIRILQQRREHYLTLAMSVAGLSSTPVQGGEKNSRTESAAIGLAEVADKLEKQAEQYLAAIRPAEELIEKLDKPRHREVLSLHYLQGYSWGRVSVMMGYQDPKSVFRVHGWALLAADKILNGR